MHHTEPVPPLPRAEVIKAVEGKHPSRIPLIMAHWWGEGLKEQYGDRLKEFDRYPRDAGFVTLPRFDTEAMGLSWKPVEGGAYDSGGVITDWAQLDEFIAKLPDPAQNPRYEEIIQPAARIHAEDRYLIIGWWGFFFETLWGLRGMEHQLMDYYDHPDKIHRLHAALCDFFCRSIQRAADMVKPDGFWTSDDLGNQTQPMLRPAMFDELIKPYYRVVGKLLKSRGIHWWLHTCGNIGPLLPSLIDAGLNMVHPIQKHTMDERQTAERFGNQIGFWAGFDVQHILREGTPEDVRAEVRFLVDTFDRPEGRMAIAAGNGIVSGIPFENIEAFLDEATWYGREHRLRQPGRPPAG